MAVSYSKQWKMLIDRKMSHVELQRAAEAAPNTMTKMRSDQPVNLAILDRMISQILWSEFMRQPTDKTVFSFAARLACTNQVKQDGTGCCGC